MMKNYYIIISTEYDRFYEFFIYFNDISEELLEEGKINTILDKNDKYFTNSTKDIIVIDANNLHNKYKNINTYDESENPNTKLLSEFAENIKNALDWAENKTIYISLHPGGKEKGFIEKYFRKFNKQLKSENINIIVTYHGTYNKKADKAIQDDESLSDFLTAIRDFSKPDIEGEIQKNKEFIALQTAILSELFNENGDINKELCEFIFNVNNCDEIKSKIENYQKNLKETNNVISELLNEIEEGEKKEKDEPEAQLNEKNDD